MRWEKTKAERMSVSDGKRKGKSEGGRERKKCLTRFIN